MHCIAGVGRSKFFMGGISKDGGCSEPPPPVLPPVAPILEPGLELPILPSFVARNVIQGTQNSVRSLSNIYSYAAMLSFRLTRIWFDMSKFSRLFRQLNTFDRSRKFSFFPKMTRACPELSRLDSLTLAFCRRKLCSSSSWKCRQQQHLTSPTNIEVSRIWLWYQF